MKHNLFRQAPREMSNSAFWAWVLQSVDSDDQLLTDVRQLGEIVLADLGVGQFVVPVCARTEKRLGRSAQIDIHWADAGETVLLIENKVEAIPDLNQLERFDNWAETQPGVILRAVFSTGIDDFVRDLIPGNWKYRPIERQLEWLEEVNIENYILSEFKTYLIDRWHQQQNNRDNAMSNDPDQFSLGLRTHAGQAEFMKRLLHSVKEDVQDAWIKQNTNVSGSPAYQLWFYEGLDKLFFRLDELAQGWCLRLQHYRCLPDEEHLRFQRIADLWTDAVHESEANLIPFAAGLPALNQLECPAAVYNLAANPPPVLLEEISTAFEAFMPMLLADPEANGL